MKICVVQTRPATGDIPANIERHTALIELASAEDAEVIVFPELSLTGYEPSLASALGLEEDDRRLDTFQKLSDDKNVTIVVGAPIKTRVGIHIGLIIIQPKKPRQSYCKQYLHPDEDAFFVTGPRSAGLIGKNNQIALAICYELSVPEHAANASSKKASIYVASVAKFARGMESAFERLSEIACEYSMAVLMANSIGSADGGQCDGQSAVWNCDGCLVGQLDNISEGILIFDTESGVVRMIRQETGK